MEGAESYVQEVIGTPNHAAEVINDKNTKDDQNKANKRLHSELKVLIRIMEVQTLKRGNFSLIQLNRNYQRMAHLVRNGVNFWLNS